MEKDKKIFLGIVILISLVAIGLGGYLLTRKEEKPVKTSSTISDGEKFKKEYEDQNNKKNANNNTYIELNIASDNPMKYTSIQEINQILENGSGIIYFGYPTCPWCRNLVPVLLDVAKNNNIKDIYYLNMYEIRDTYDVVNGVLTKTKEEQNGYLEILDHLKDYLEDYIVTDSDGNEYNTNEKRLYVPTIVVVKNGKITGFHVGTVELNSKQTPYNKLTEKQQKELYDILEEMMVDKGNSYCTDNEMC